MPNYRRARIPGGAFFLTLVTHQRKPLFQSSDRVQALRQAISQVKTEAPFEIVAAVILPDHIHFIWKLPTGDTNFSRRVSRFKVLFTRSQLGFGASATADSESRRKHRESNIWQRRFWEHTIRGETDLGNCLNYIHYNPVKHGLVSCPHQWKYSSFHTWVKQGYYASDWGCTCHGKTFISLKFNNLSYIKE